MTLRIRDDPTLGLPLPAAVISISPWMMTDPVKESMDTHLFDILSADSIASMIQSYTPHTMTVQELLESPYVCPLKASTFAGLPCSCTPEALRSCDLRSMNLFAVQRRTVSCVNMRSKRTEVIAGSRSTLPRLWRIARRPSSPWLCIGQDPQGPVVVCLLLIKQVYVFEHGCPLQSVLHVSVEGRRIRVLAHRPSKRD